jgi:hypothetical protein
VIVGAAQAQIAEHGSETLLTTTGIASSPTTAARHRGALEVGVIRVEQSLECLASDTQRTAPDGDLECPEVSAGRWP